MSCPFCNPRVIFIIHLLTCSLKELPSLREEPGGLQVKGRAWEGVLQGKGSMKLYIHNREIQKHSEPQAWTVGPFTDAQILCSVSLTKGQSVWWEHLQNQGAGGEEWGEAESLGLVFPVPNFRPGDTGLGGGHRNSNHSQRPQTPL